MTEHPRQKDKAKYPALCDLRVTVLSSQHETDWLDSAVAEYVAKSDPAGLTGARAKLSAA